MSIDISPAVTGTITHPLDPITAEEIERFRDVLTAAGLVHEAVRFGYVMLREPEKAEVLAFQAGDPIATREISAVLLDQKTHVQSYVIVDLLAGAVVHLEHQSPGTDGHLPFLEEELFLAHEITMADERFQQGLIERGITDFATVLCNPLAGGVFGYDDEVGVRVTRVLAYQLPEQWTGTLIGFWGQPIEGLVAHVDMTNGKVLRVIDVGTYEVPSRSRSDFFDPAVRGADRTDLKPIAITQPEGASFTLDGNRLTWGRWDLRIGFSAREGISLHQVTYTDAGVARPVLYRASLAEMVVNYGDVTPTRSWQNYFDAGEYQFGRFAASLELGCDCLGEITYVPAVFADDLGRPKTVPNAICIHEEDTGIAWKHTDPFTMQGEVRRGRRLVISSFLNVGNYDYGFYWHLTLDGRIELEVKATGVLYTSAVRDGDYPFAPEVAPKLGAPVHQHLFCVRLDVSIDGQRNHVDEIDVVPVPMDRDNPWGGAFRPTETRLLTERGAQRVADMPRSRTWRISSSDTVNPLGKAPAYVLHPEGKALLLAAEHSPIGKRAVFATKHLWVTRYHRDERWPAGYLPSQHPGGAGLPAYAADDEPVDGEDIVVWHTFGLTHVPRPEDWPVMPVDRASMTLAPSGFFDRNPVLDLPAAADHCAPAQQGHEGHAGHHEPSAEELDANGPHTH